jgi:molecular chaperone DnaK (HSP70)
MWDGRQRQRLLSIAHQVGLHVPAANLVDEPVAAGIAWLAHHPGAATGPTRILVFDMGGGTLDVAVLDERNTPEPSIAVLASSGIAKAGDSLDDALADMFERDLLASGADAGDPDQVHEFLTYVAREMKIALSTAERYTVIGFRDLFGPGREVEYRRDQLNTAFAPLMDQAQACVAAVLRAARLTEVAPGDAMRPPIEALAAGVDVVVLAGGMSHVPYVQQRLRALFGPAARIEFATPAPEDAVALGLVLSGRYRRTNRYQAPFDIVLEWAEGQCRHTLYPAFTPIVEPHQIVAGGSDLRYVADLRGVDLPSDQPGRLRLISPTGQPIRAELDGLDVDGFHVRLNGAAFEFSLYPSGHIRVTDAAGVYRGQINGW